MILLLKPTFACLVTIGLTVVKIVWNENDPKRMQTVALKRLAISTATPPLLASTDQQNDTSSNWEHGKHRRVLVAVSI